MHRLVYLVTWKIVRDATQDDEDILESWVLLRRPMVVSSKKTCQYSREFCWSPRDAMRGCHTENAKVAAEPDNGDKFHQVAEEPDVTDKSQNSVADPSDLVDDEPTAHDLVAVVHARVDEEEVDESCSIAVTRDSTLENKERL